MSNINEKASPNERITLTAVQLREAAYWASPDNDPNEDDTEVVIEWIPQCTAIDGEVMEAGDYLSYVECPEEGVIGPLGKYPLPDAVRLPEKGTHPTTPPMTANWRQQVEKAIQRAKQFDDGSDGADAESAQSVVAILTELLKGQPQTNNQGSDHAEQ